MGDSDARLAGGLCCSVCARLWLLVHHRTCERPADRDGYSVADAAHLCTLRHPCIPCDGGNTCLRSVTAVPAAGLQLHDGCTVPVLYAAVRLWVFARLAVCDATLRHCLDSLCGGQQRYRRDRPADCVAGCAGDGAMRLVAAASAASPCVAHRCRRVSRVCRLHCCGAALVFPAPLQHPGVVAAGAAAYLERHAARRQSAAAGTGNGHVAAPSVVCVVPHVTQICACSVAHCGCCLHGLSDWFVLGKAWSERTHSGCMARSVAYQHLYRTRCSGRHTDPRGTPGAVVRRGASAALGPHTCRLGRSGGLRFIAATAACACRRFTTAAGSGSGCASGAVRAGFAADAVPARGVRCAV